MEEQLKTKIRNAPMRPGVYLMRNAAGEVIYVGKARDLRNRLASYLGTSDLRPMIPFLLARVQDVDFIVTETEKEALILENNLIKNHRPRYNVVFRDDKTYFHLRLDLNNPFPRLELFRRPRRDGAKYFGPYPSSGAAKETWRFIQQIFPLRTCSDIEMKNRPRPCLEYEIGRCLAPCVGRIDRRAYGRLVEETVAFLEGRVKKLLADLLKRMEEEAHRLNYEAAAKLRDRIQAIEATVEKQRTSSSLGKDQDVFGLYAEEGLTKVCVLFIRQGKLLDKKVFPLMTIPERADYLLGALIQQFYHEGTYIPAEVILPCKLEDHELLTDWLKEKRGGPLALLTPKKGKRADLLALARLNAKDSLQAELAEIDPQAVLELMKQKFSLKKMPRRIEGYDLSNIGGTYAVGSRVTFQDGLPWKKGYRHFRIGTAGGLDDYGMMYEILKRRLSSEKDEPWPDLIVVDGGRGHLGVALSVLKDLQLAGIEAIALAKEHREDSRGQGGDRVYLPGRKDPLYPARWPAVYLLLQRIRNEAHRFARSYHHKIKTKGDLASRLDAIAGIGPVRKKALLTIFPSVDAIMKASPAEIARVAGLGPKLTEKLLSGLKEDLTR